MHLKIDHNPHLKEFFVSIHTKITTIQGTLIAHLPWYKTVFALSSIIFIVLTTPLLAVENEVPLWESINKDMFTGDLPQLKKRKIIRALVIYSKTDFFIHKGDLRGIQAEYLSEYEKFINKGIKNSTDKIKIVPIPVTLSRIIPNLVAGKGDIAAVFLTITPEREKKIAFTSGSKVRVNELIITNKATDAIRNLEDLAGRSVHVLYGSSYLEHLQKLNRNFTKKGLKSIHIVQLNNLLSGEDLLEMLNSGIIQATVADDFRARLWARVLPNIKVREDLVINQSGRIGWAVRKNSPRLLKNLNQAAKQAQRGTLLGNVLFNRYYKNTQWINNPISETESKRLEQYMVLFKKYGDLYKFDYQALLAQAFQESRLDQNKRNPSGALGIMQVLPSTAADKNIQIKNIEELEANIHAGTKYMAFLRERYFSSTEISTLDQLFFSWAAYNAGPRKVQRMRNLAKKSGLDENKWFRNVEIAAGKIVGRETVRYVSNIYKYYIAYTMAPR